MYIHLGNEMVVNEKDIVGIFDLETTTISKHSRKFLEVAEKLCHRVGIIKNGKLVAEGKVADVVGDKSLESIFLDIAKESENE